MKTYVLKLNDEGVKRWGDYDEHFGFVVRAENEADARLMCADESGRRDAWLLALWSDCVCTDTLDAGIVLEDYHAG